MKCFIKKHKGVLLSVTAAVLLFIAVFFMAASTPAYGKFTSRIEQSFDLIIHPTKPIMAERGSWYRGTTDKSEIVTVTFAEADYLSNHPDLSYDEIFYADAKNIGTIQCFVVTDGNGKNLIISGNRYGEINDVYANADSSGMFSGFSALTGIVAVNQLDVSGVSDFSGMFAGLGIISLNLSGWETASAVDTSEMFKNCASLTEVTVTQSFNLSGVSDSTDMFLGCTNIVGRHGTVYDSGKTDKEYARTDTTNNKGYFLGDTVTITFDANGGSGTMPEQYILPNVTDTLVNENGVLEITGYHVGGWNTQADGNGTAFTDGGSITVAEDIILFAVWSPNTYTVTYDANGGQLSGLIEGNTSVVTYGLTYGEGTNLSTIGTLPTATMPGYTFCGWNGFSLPSEYQEVEYLQSNGTQYLNIDNNITEPFDISITLMADVTRGWMGTNGKCQLRVNEYCKAQKKLVFRATRETNTTYYYIDGLLKESNSHTDGGAFWLFNMYGHSDPCYCKIYAVYYRDANTELHLVPCYRKSDGKPGMYDAQTGSFFTNMGSGADFTVGINVGFTASGVVNILEDNILTALWSPNTYTVTLKTNDETGSTRAEGFTDGDTYQVVYNGNYASLPVPTRRGYTFEGWSSTPDGAAEYTSDDTVQITENCLFYADWTPITCTVTYEACGGAISGLSEGITSTVAFDSTYGEGTNLSVPGVLPTASMEGYDFVGWNISEIPSEYVEVEYLQSTGTQKLIIDNSFKGPFDVSITLMTDVATGWMGLNGTCQFRVNSLCPVGSKVVFRAIRETNSTRYYINDVLKESNSYLYSGQFWLFNMCGFEAPCKCRIYEVVYQDADTVRHLIPCYRRSDRKPGMYDLITDTFFVNQSTGTDFTLGPDIFNGQDACISASTFVTSSLNHTVYAVWEQSE